MYLDSENSVVPSQVTKRRGGLGVGILCVKSPVDVYNGLDLGQVTQLIFSCFSPDTAQHLFIAVNKQLGCCKVQFCKCPFSNLKEDERQCLFTLCVHRQGIPMKQWTNRVMFFLHFERDLNTWSRLWVSLKCIFSHPNQLIHVTRNLHF